MHDAYEAVIGLEIHVELSTKSKMFCSCPVTFGRRPNTVVCPVCTGMPGALPVLNRQAVRYAAMAGLALHCTVHCRSRLARKQYFYPDLPKGYQISQSDKPLCEHGYLRAEADGKPFTVGITRIHIEEDAGKLFHTKEGTLLDCNRCGVPLIEIVSEPDIRSAAQAVAYARQIRSIMRYLGISDCRMEQGSLRCDINLSVRKKGDTAFGTRTEIKNVNSFAFMQKAIEYECDRQCALLENGQSVLQETRRYDEKTATTQPMRQKENAVNYRYFPDPDLPEVILCASDLQVLRDALPVLPDERREALHKHGISKKDAALICADRTGADYFARAMEGVQDAVLLSHFYVSNILPAAGEEIIEGQLPVSHGGLAALCNLITEGKINTATAKKVLTLLRSPDEDPAEVVARENLGQITDEQTLLSFVRKAIALCEQSRADYYRGKAAAAGAVVGRVMALTQGRADPRLTNELILRTLEAERPR